MPRPDTAPPSVIVLSWGTTSGMRPCRSVASARSSYVVMPPTRAVLVSGSTQITRPNADTSSPATGAASRNRNRFDVRLASRIRLPGGIAA